jgi:hypothetical protein
VTCPPVLYNDGDSEDDDENDHVDIACSSSFATALHTVQIQTPRPKSNSKQRTSSNNVVHEPRVTCKEVASYCLSEDEQAARSTSPNMICVGYSSCPGWEVIVLLDTSTIPLSQILLDPGEANTNTAATTTATATAPTSHFNSNSSVAPSNIMSDDVSIATAVTSSIAMAAAAHHEVSASRRGGGGGGGVDIGGGGAGPARPRRTVSSSEISVPESLAASDFDESTTMNINNNSNNNNNSSTSGIRAMLILRSFVVHGDSNNDIDNNEGRQPKCCRYSTQLSFRPLAPVVRLVGPKHHPPSKNRQQQQEANNTPIIWLGSADTSQLYCFTLGEKVVFADVGGSSATNDDGDDVLQTRMDLVPVALSDPEFIVESPVMALDCLNINNNNNNNNKDNGENDEHENTEPSMVASSTKSSTRDDRGCCCCCLAISCQDGTIRFVVFFVTKAIASSNVPIDGGLILGAFDNVQATTFIIDGPSVCIQLSCSNHRWWHDSSNEPTVYATIGSLCGYVTVLYTRDIFGKFLAETSSSNDLNRKHDSISWEGPFIMAEGFWNHHLEAEDSVLAVHDVGRNGMVALGTHSGRCFLYQAVNKISHSINSNQQEKYGEHIFYCRLWECQLPYSIHGICHVSNCSRSDGKNVPLSLLVTTRKSIHLFTQQTPRFVFDASLAKTRIDALLQRVPQRRHEDVVQAPESATTKAAESTTRLDAGEVATEKPERGESSSSTIHSKSGNVQ